MALPDLTGLNIEDTYQRVLQTDGVNIYDGTGSIVNIAATGPFATTGSNTFNGTQTINGDVSIGTTGSISSRLHVRGSGATIATTTLRIENNNGTPSLQVFDNGLVQYTTTTAEVLANPYPFPQPPATLLCIFPKTITQTFKVMYSIKEGSNIRAGEYLCVHDGTTINTIHTFPTEFGDTSLAVIEMYIFGDDIYIYASISTHPTEYKTWTIKASVQIL